MWHRCRPWVAKSVSNEKSNRNIKGDSMLICSDHGPVIDDVVKEEIKVSVSHSEEVEDQYLEHALSGRSSLIPPLIFVEPTPFEASLDEQSLLLHQFSVL